MNPELLEASFVRQFGKYLRRSEKQYIKTKLARHVVKNEDLKCVICEKKKDNLRWKTCSEECSLKLARQTRSRLSKQSYVRKQMDKENIVLCSFCHKNSFKRIGNNKFCSPVCKENNLKQLKEKIKGVLVNNLLCSNCHKSFKHYDQRRRYCSVECSTISNTLRQKKQCKICEKEFAGCRTTQSCSQKCSTILKIATLNN
ncbi:10337_t:CDS:2 [Funneliformis geosporum]|nr:10337_t:CDS:2 [Funneliformis geosporum]